MATYQNGVFQKQLWVLTHSDFQHSSLSISCLCITSWSAKSPRLREKCLRDIVPWTGLDQVRDFHESSIFFWDAEFFLRSAGKNENEHSISARRCQCFIRDPKREYLIVVNETWARNAWPKIRFVNHDFGHFPWNHDMLYSSALFASWTSNQLSKEA